MKFILFTFSLIIFTSRVLSSPPPAPPVVNATEDVLEVAGDPEEVTVRYDLGDDLSKTTVSERRSLDLTPPMGENGAIRDDLILKRFGNDYFLNEDQNVSVPLPTSSPGVIQKVRRKSVISEEDKEDQFEDRQDFVSGQEVAVPNPNISGVNWLLNIFNPHHWNPSSLPGAPNISDGCKRDVRTYLRALRNGTIWAAKSEYLFGF